MVGGFRFIWTRVGAPTTWRSAIPAGLLVALVLVASGPTGFRIGTPLGEHHSPSALRPRLPDVSAPPSPDAPRSLATPAALPAKPRVSMSAAVDGPNAGPGDGRRPHDVPDDFPLTRAAARQRIDSMSPAGWLAHYGAVSIERHE